MIYLFLQLTEKRTFTILCSLLLCVSIIQAQEFPNDKYNLLVGTYTKPGKSDGIYVYEFNSKTGEFSYRSEVAGIKNPSFLTVSEDGKHVYSVNEIGGGKGSVSAFSFDAGTGKIAYINSISSGGNGPCYITVDKMNKYVFVGNYSGGSLAAVPIRDDGSLGTAIQSIRHGGKSISSRQQASHVHATVLSEDDRFLYVPDLGTDKIYIYDVDVSGINPLAPSNPEYIQVTPGSGPRHFTFHPNNKYAYSIQELQGIVTAFKYVDGTLQTLQSVNLVASNSKGSPSAADIHISPDGKFLYGSLRGKINELVVYAIDQNGKLEYVGRHSTLGKGPRNFAIDPTGNFLLVGNGGSDEIVIFKRNKATGLLTATGKTIKVGTPVCLKFVAIK